MGHSIKRSTSLFTLASLLVALLGAVLRLAFVLWVPTQPVSDFWSYMARAANMIDRGVYQEVPGRVDASYPPAYPLVIALSFHVLPDRLLSAKLLNVSLAAGAIFVLAHLARSLAGEKVGIASAAILALYTRSVLTPLTIASENLSSLLVFGFLLLLLKACDGAPGPRASALAGLVAGFLALTRSIAYPVWLLWPIAAYRRGVPGRPILRDMLIVAATAHLILLPWAIRNVVALGAFTPLTSNAGRNLYMGNNPQSPGYWYAFTEGIRQVDPAWDTRTIIDKDRAAAVIAVRWMVAHPGDALQLYVRKLAIMMSDETFIGFFAIYGELVAPPYPPSAPLIGDHVLKANAAFVDRVLNSSYAVLTILELLGIAAFWRGSEAAARRKASCLVLTAVYFPAASAIFLASSRFRWPLTDVLIPFAAFFILTGYDRIRQTKIGTADPPSA